METIIIIGLIVWCLFLHWRLHRMQVFIKTLQYGALVMTENQSRLSDVVDQAVKNQSRVIASAEKVTESQLNLQKQFSDLLDAVKRSLIGKGFGHGN